MAQESVLRIIIDSRNAERNARNIANELQNIERNGNHASRSMDSMSVATRSLVGYMGGLVTIGAAISKMDAYTGLQNRLKLVTDSQAELNTAMNDTFGIAQKTASSWDSVAMVYQRFADNADRLNITMAQTSALAETVSKAISVSGGSAASAEAALMQFGQALASGVLRGEEFNSIAEQAPGLLKAIAFGLNTNVGSLRAMAADGKITGDVLVESLSKAQPYIDDLFNKTDFTISQSFTKLSNEITKFVGEAGKGSGAASALSDSIGFLANNLSTIADIAIVGGVAMLTKTILAQTVAIQGSITASVARRSTLLAELAVQAAASTAEVARTGAIAQFTAMQLVDAKATAARMTGIQRLAYVQATVIPLEAKAIQMTAAHTTATAADTVVQNANNAARSRGAMLLRMIGGPIGLITLGVAGLAAGYMYLKNRTAEANAKLEEQAAVAKKAKEELLALKGLEKDDAIDKMTASFERQNKALSESSSKINMQLNAIEQLYKGNKEVAQVVQDARNGTISMTDAVQRFNALRISKEVYESVKENTVEFEKNAKEATNTKAKLNLFGIEVELAGRKAQTAVAGLDENSKALKGNKSAAEDATKAQKDFKASLFDRDFEAHLTKGLLAKGYSPEQVKSMVDTATWARKNNVKISNDLYQIGLQTLSIEQQNNKVIEARNKSLRDNTTELTKQQKVLQTSSQVQANASKYNFGGLESKYNLPSGMLSALHAIETGNTGKTNQVNKQTGATGGFQFLKGTAQQYGVNDRTDMSQSAEGAAKYMSYLLKLFKGDLEKAVRAYHAGEGNVQKGKNIGKYNNDYWQKFKGYSAGVNGYSAGDISTKDFEKILEEATKLSEEQANSRKSLELEVASEVTKIRESLKDKLLEIDKAGFSPERTKELRAEYQTRADNEVAIAEYALKTKLDDYESSRKTESQLLEDSFNERKFYASRDLELTKEQRDKAVALLDEQLKQEQALIKLAYETRLFQLRENLMSETAAMQERYRLEREQILLNSKLSQEQKLREIALSKALQEEENRKRLNSAVQQWGGINAEMTGTTDQFNFEKERFDRLDASQALFDAELAMAGENYALKEQAYQAYVDRMIAIENAYQMSSVQLQLGYGEQMASSMSTMMGAIFGEKSKAYAAAFAVEKAFAVAQAALAMGQNIAQASKMGFPYNIPMIAGAMAQGAQIASIISSVAQPTGYADGGFTGAGGKFDPAGIVHKGEVVWSQEDIKRWGGVNVVEAMRTSQPPKGYSDGGLVTPQDTYRVGMGTVDAINRGADVQAERQAQASAKAQSANPQPIENNLRVIMVKDEDEAKDWLYNAEGEKAFLYHLKRNRSKI